MPGNGPESLRLLRRVDPVEPDSDLLLFPEDGQSIAVTDADYFGCEIRCRQRGGKGQKPGEDTGKPTWHGREGCKLIAGTMDQRITGEVFRFGARI
jgi:hypothetical protein